MNKYMATPAIYKKNVEITPLQERLLDYFENDDCDLPLRITAYEWIFEEVLYNSTSDLSHKNRAYLLELGELVKILRGIQQGF